MGEKGQAQAEKRDAQERPGTGDKVVKAVQDDGCDKDEKERGKEEARRRLESAAQGPQAPG